jgi:hypothetical protein
LGGDLFADLFADFRGGDFRADFLADFRGGDFLADFRGVEDFFVISFLDRFLVFDGFFGLGLGLGLGVLIHLKQEHLGLPLCMGFPKRLSFLP